MKLLPSGWGLTRRRTLMRPQSAAGLEDGEGGMERSSRSVSAGLQGFLKDIRAAPDRGKSFYHTARQRQHLASLVEAGRHAGRSRVEYAGRNITYHLFTKDFFISVINQKTTTILLVTAFVYLLVFFFFSIWWYLIVLYYPGCLYGASSYVEAFTFTIVTHMTIGYGNTGPQQCWAAAWLIAIQIIIALLLESIVIGIVFARISHPKQRSRSIFISDSAIIARRDGILKFMFRVADIRRTQVVDPKIKAFMYTWGEGRVTAEGEQIPVRCEPLDIGYIDGMLLLPLIIEHTIDERSPLCGHTHDSLLALNAEIVVTFEGTTEFGNPFMARRSYLPTEVHWGHQFAQIVMKPGGENTCYNIDLNKFHDVVPQDGLPMLPPSALSQLVVNRAKRTVPYPLLGENTLVLSDVCVMGPNDQGEPCLMCRAADTYPNQMLEITVRMYLYRWRKPGDAEGPVYTQHLLECGYSTGEDRLYLRLPMEVRHVIDEDSPIRRWLEPGGMLEDADSEIVVVMNAYLHVTGQNRLRQRTYTVHNHVKYGCRFKNIVKHPADSRDRKPRVRWAHFHDIETLSPEEGGGALPPREDVGMMPLPAGPSPPGGLAAILEGAGPSVAPESHGAIRSVEQRQRMWASSSESAEAPSISTTGASSRPGVPPSASGGNSLAGLWTASQQGGGGAAAAGAGMAAAAAGAGPWRGGYRPSLQEMRNDYTVLPIDLSRYAATAGNEGDSIPLGEAGGAARRLPLPTDFATQLSAARRHQEEVEEGKAAPFLLFPEVAEYGLSTIDAGESLPHPQALHPTLPRQWMDLNERGDFTVMPSDLSRYMAQVGRSDTLPRGTGPVTLGEASRLMARAAQQQEEEAPEEQQQAQPQPQQPQPEAALEAVAAAAATAAAAAGELPAGDRQGAAPAAPMARVSALPAQRLRSSSSTGKLQQLQGPTPGEAAAAAALAAAAVEQAEQQQAAEQQHAVAPEQQQQQAPQLKRVASPGRPPLPPAHPAVDAAPGSTAPLSTALAPPSTVGSDSSVAGRSAAGEEEGAREMGEEELQQFAQRISRTTSSWRMHEQEMESEEEQEGAGPIHLARPDWQSGRALKNLFAPGSPTAGGAEDADGAGGGGDSSGQAGGAAKSSGGSQAGEAGRALKGLFAPGSPATGDAEDGYGAGGGGDSSSPAGEGQ